MCCCRAHGLLRVGGPSRSRGTDTAGQPGEEDKWTLLPLGRTESCSPWLFISKTTPVFAWCLLPGVRMNTDEGAQGAGWLMRVESWEQEPLGCNHTPGMELVPGEL